MRRCSMSPRPSPQSTYSSISLRNKKGRSRRTALSNSSGKLRSLFQLDGAAGILDLLLDLLGFFLVDAFLDGLRSAFDQRLRLAEAEAGDRADFLDHVDLLAAVAGEDDVELGLFFGGRASGSCSGRSGGNGGGGGNAPLLFEGLGEIRCFEDGQFGKLVDQLGDVSHLILLGGAPAPGCRALMKNLVLTRLPWPRRQRKPVPAALPAR